MVIIERYAQILTFNVGVCLQLFDIPSYFISFPIDPPFVAMLLAPNSTG